MFSTSTLLTLMSLTCTFAIPLERRLEDIQCRCLSTSTNTKSMFCTYLEPHVLDWQAAYKLAAQNDLEIQFASEAITGVLLKPRLLPTGILQRLSEAEATLPSNHQTEMPQTETNKIVCELGDTVRYGNGPATSHPKAGEEHYVSAVLGTLMLLLILYVVGQYVWNRFLARGGTIKLEGEEKTLMAKVTVTPTSHQLQQVICTAPADYS
ncbi:hypothetical protein BDW02DRAFT_600462 [Decorospora gaudefroyi]|uniref:Uncharacterized protein n=1 Tax=Decorospora gaudefroyi TaxID=184978 RepID=A0A6A5K5B5_9PLEO|nr:hypothetical protein BDW02DRAFT_600462 [Decorospora gaudefroyi]